MRASRERRKIPLIPLFQRGNKGDLGYLFIEFPRRLV